MAFSWRLPFAFLLIACAGVKAAEAPPATRPAIDFTHTWLLHLPGIGGEMPIDHDMTAGLRDGEYAGRIDIYDWTENQPGLSALLARQRNEREARKIAGMIESRLRKDPSLRITLTSHSAGTGLAVWALEKLPPDMKVQTLVLLAPALSPKYDLSAALRHVRGKAYAFYSSGDTLILGAGTAMFGTVDGVRTVAAGLVGFSRPKDADPTQYQKLVQIPYDKSWLKYGDDGDHIGCMTRRFGQHVVAPVVLKGLEAAGKTAHPDSMRNK